MTETIQVRLPSDVKKQFQRVIDLEGATVSDDIRAYIDRKIQSYAVVKAKAAQ